MKHKEPDSCCKHDSHSKKQPLYKNGFFVTVTVTALIYAASFIFQELFAFRAAFNGYVKMMLLPIFLGLLAGGVIDYCVPKEYITKYLAAHRKRTIFYSVGFGFLMSACSHGILALSMELHKKGASTASVISFLLASPWANLPITFLLIGFFGWKGFIIILCSLCVAMTSGLIFQQLEKRGWVERNENTVSVEADFSIGKDIRKRLSNFHADGKNISDLLKGVWKGTFELSEMILWWIALGILLASFLSAYVPSHLFRTYMGPTPGGLFVTLIAATILEVCSEGTSPLAFEIYKQTAALGNAFAFLMGGVVTDYTEIGLVWMNIGKRAALWMIAITIPQVVILALILNRLF